MAYTPTNWECGDVVTAEALNHMEQGIVSNGECIYWVNIIEGEPDGGVTSYVADKTFAEITQALTDGKAVILRYEYGELTTYYTLVEKTWDMLTFSSVVPRILITTSATSGTVLPMNSITTNAIVILDDDKLYFADNTEIINVT